MMICLREEGAGVRGGSMFLILQDLVAVGPMPHAGLASEGAALALWPSPVPSSVEEGQLRRKEIATTTETAHGEGLARGTYL